MKAMKNCWLSVALLLFAGASSAGCTDKRHDCAWLGTCDREEMVPGAAGSSSIGTTGGSSNTNPTDTTAGGAGTGGTASAAASGGTTTSAGAAGTSFSAAGSTAGQGGASTSELVVVGGSAGAAGVAGIANIAGAAGATEPPCSGQPKDSCSIDARYAVFVSSKGNDQGDGSPDYPLRSLDRAMIVAKTGRKKSPLNVFVCADADSPFILERALKLTSDIADGISIYGGFSCKSGEGWKYEPTLRAQFISQESTAIRLEGVNSLYIENLSITAADASTTSPGKSSIAVVAVDSPGITLNRVDITAGNGTKGSDGTGTSGSATSGSAGKKGVEACGSGIGGGSANEGQQVTTTCDGVAGASTGGKGGDGGIGINTAGSGNGGLPAPDPNTSDWGYEGIGEGSRPCEDGKDGAPGLFGELGRGGTGPGTLSKKEDTPFITSDGANGTDGKPGQGGGGGGGAKAPLPPAVCALNGVTIDPPVGASGGSGGSGGCGGKGGKGGTGGGASIALALINSPMKLENCTLTSKQGGAGGKGGPGQSGGAGGTSGSKSAGAGSKPSCAGGLGGNGGDGAHGGGGAGGASIAVAWNGTAPTIGTNVVYHHATDAAPGGLDGGGSATSAGAGAKGALADSLDLAVQQ